LNLDPWAEAAALARLPKEAAISRLTSLIIRLPQGALVHLDLSAASARLVVLLPRLASFEILPNEISRRTGVVTHHRPASAYVMAVIMVIVFGIQYLYSNHQTPPSHIRTPVHSVSLRAEPRRNGP
jgi:hypothetical protein